MTKPVFTIQANNKGKQDTPCTGYYIMANTTIISKALPYSEAAEKAATLNAVLNFVV